MCVVHNPRVHLHDSLHRNPMVHATAAVLPEGEGVHGGVEKQCYVSFQIIGNSHPIYMHIALQPLILYK